MSQVGFEGAEKKLLLRFGPVDPCAPEGLRRFCAPDWQKLLDKAKCTIISSLSNEHFDSYVLSESSLFVYPDAVVVKTCGTTVPLNVIPGVLQYAGRMGLSVSVVLYCRKNFRFPHVQPTPHGSFANEVAELQRFFPEGSAHVLGPLNDEHWNLFLADYTAVTQSRLQILEIMMQDLDRDAMKQFYKTDAFVSAKSTTVTSGIADILPGSASDECQFEPCGFSVNGLLDETYYTIHVTPEPHCSFVSFETNAPVADYTAIIQRVLSVFKPGRFSISIISGAAAPVSAFALSPPFQENFFGFARTYHSATLFSGHAAQFFNFVEEDRLMAARRAAASIPFLSPLCVANMSCESSVSVSC